MNYGLGRLESHDERDKNFPMRAALPKLTERRYRYWNQSGWWGNQLDKPHCVGFAWLHWLEDGPVTHNQTPAPMIIPATLYSEAQKIDEWEGEAYDGTSVRAGAKILQAKGLVKEYRWTTNVEDLINAVLTTSPVVVGTNWYYQMFMTDLKGFIKPEGALVGGHAYLINGVNRDREMFRIKNSWGREWGREGNAFISFKDMQLLLNQDGECCLAIENK